MKIRKIGARLLSAQAKELERVGKELVKRGYADYASGGYVVMYLPSQAVYEAAAENCPDVIESLLAARVVVAGPTALYALVANVAALLTEHRAIRQADEILQQARELHRRMGTFLGHLCSLGTHLQRAVGAYNQAAGSWERRLSPQLERMVELTGLGSLEAPERVEEPVREFSTTYPRLATGSEGR
ncbi:MAG: hypothetical protein KatS3mg011_1669 [Acidimicrobiia bacterium]|nr:MAG: hypothetical protein KatS3mg011_1669 [Acidimicrobiia bacterium]